MAKQDRDVESFQSIPDFAAKLRRLADALETGESFRIQVAGERFRVPRNARMSVEHERDGNEEELELQLTWTVDELEGDDDEGETV